MKVNKINPRNINGIEIPDEIVTESLKNYYEKDKLVRTINETMGKKYITEYEFNDRGLPTKASSYIMQDKILKKSDVIAAVMNTEYDDKDRVTKIYSEESRYCKIYDYEDTGWWETIMSGDNEEIFHYTNDGKVLYYHQKIDGQLVSNFTLRKNKDRIYTTEKDLIKNIIEKKSYKISKDGSWLVTKITITNSNETIVKEIKYNSNDQPSSEIETTKLANGKSIKNKEYYTYDTSGRLIEFKDDKGNTNKVTYMKDYSITELRENDKVYQVQRYSLDKKKLITEFRDEVNGGLIVYTYKDEDPKKCYNIIYNALTKEIAQAFFSYKDSSYNFKLHDKGYYTLAVTTYRTSKSDQIKEAYTINTNDMLFYNEMVKLMENATLIKLGSTNF